MSGQGVVSRTTNHFKFWADAGLKPSTASPGEEEVNIGSVQCGRWTNQPTKTKHRQT